MEAPGLLRCPISMEVMEDPVTIITGVTYERKNIEKWLFVYKKTTCPATMQPLKNFDLIPNHTLKRLISSLNHPQKPPAHTSPRTSLSAMMEHDNFVSILASIETSPFKVTSLRKLKSIMERNKNFHKDFIAMGGIQVLSSIMCQTVQESTDFTAFRACEEAVGVLSLLPFAEKSAVELILNPECMQPMLEVMLQRGSAEARIQTMSILLQVSKVTPEWMNDTITNSDVDIIKSLLELLSDDVTTKLSSSALDLLLEIVASSRMNRVKAIEAGAVWIMVELLAESNRHNCEKVLLLLKRLCKLPEGISAFAEHDLAIAAVSKKILRVSEAATKLGVSVLWLVCSCLSTERVLGDMLVFGAVRKMLALLHIGGLSSTKQKAMQMIKLHGDFWRQYPCFPSELHDFLRVSHNSH